MLRDEKHFYECMYTALANSLLKSFCFPVFLILKITSMKNQGEMDSDYWPYVHESISAWACHMQCNVEWCLQKNNEIHMLVISNPKMRSLDSLARTLLEALKKLFLEETFSSQSILPSLGVASTFSDATTKEHLEEMAQGALKKAMEHGLGTYGIFTFTLNDLEIAFSKQQFVLFYQPQYSVDGKTLKGVEALIRWNHPRYGIILPKHFIPMAEGSEFIISLGAWILHQACLDGKRWMPLRMGVNVSVKQFSSSGFFDSLCHILQITGMAPECLELELTEGEPITEFYTMQETMKSIKDLGVRLALDDFCEGWSRFQVLKKLEFDTLKFPPSLVQRIEIDWKSRTLFQGFMRLGLDLRMHLVIEGIENPEQQIIVQELGGQTAQGFLYAKPMSAIDMDQLFILRKKNQALA